MPLLSWIGLDCTVLNCVEPVPMRAAFESIRKLDIGGLEISYGPDDHTGLDFADLSIIGTDGKFKR